MDVGNVLGNIDCTAKALDPVHCGGFKYRCDEKAGEVTDIDLDGLIWWSGKRSAV